ncbi:IS4 family transposase [Kangiella shandongensis]|uniref:IS4 family transposase n=1 Tax=Kangiella shandongensis TaxID=2763258 RepID=UPI001CBEFE6F|nr:IS4 family transposase [Kangiella shandongensis]
MNVEKVLHNLLGKSSLNCHKSRLKALATNVDSLLHGQCLSVTGLGRSSRRQCLTKHAIKQSDRLVGNHRLEQDSSRFYQAICRQLIKHRHPRILIDWSDLTEDRAYIVLRASLVFDGRSITLYEKVHSLKEYGGRKVQHQFLHKLSQLLPSNCKPIIITDAGFLVPWFKVVESLEWYWIGRLRGSIMVKRSGAWIKCNTLYAQANSRIKRITDTEIAMSNPLPCHLYYTQSRPKRRKKMTKLGAVARSKHSQKNARRESSPWMIVTNLPSTLAKPQTVINIYKTRMQIEESFRDMKSHQFGLSMRYSLTRNVQRLTNLLLIGMLTAYITLILGYQAEKMKLHYRYQANTIKNRRVLSLQYLALQIINDVGLRHSHRDWLQAMSLIKEKLYYELS